MGYIVGLIIFAFILLNIVAFIIYGLDKRRARNNAWRISEKTLLSVATLAPWGSLLGMYVFRHKTQKKKFKVVWLSAVLDIFLIALIIYALS